MSNFRDMVSIGFDKNGECDFRVGMAIADLDRKQMDELCRLMPWAIKEALGIWLAHGPPSKEKAQAKSANG